MDRYNKKGYDYLVSMNCLNPEDYIETRLNNLKFACSCGNVINASLSTYERSSKLCKACKIGKVAFRKKEITFGDLKPLNPNDYVNVTTSNLKWLCTECGSEYTRSLDGQKRSTRCSGCATVSRGLSKRVSKDELISLGCLNPEDYNGSTDNNLRWLCKDCGEEFTQAYSVYRISTQLCTACETKVRNSKRKVPIETVALAGCLNPEDYINAKEKNLKYPCDKCGKVFLTSYDILSGKRNKKHFCETCRPSVSSGELEVLDFIKEIYKGQIFSNSREIIPPKELDIYLPYIEYAIEYNGVYWHSSRKLPNDYHSEKLKDCQKAGIKLFQIWDLDWEKKKDIIKSMLRSQILKDNYKIYARKCEIREIDNDILRDFLNINHLQGYGSGSSVRLGLFHNDELVSVMTFKVSGNTSELTRFCSKLGTTVIGGASKLLKYYQGIFEGTITSFSDNTYSDGGLYETLGFKETRKIPSDYKYLVNDELHHKFGFRHAKLKSKLENYSKDLTELENCEAHGIHRVYDSGKVKWELVS